MTLYYDFDFQDPLPGLERPILPFLPEPKIAGDDTTQTPKQIYQNLINQQPYLVGNVLQDALKAAFPFTKLTDNEKQVSLQTANVVGGAVSSTIIPCLFDLTGPFTSVSDQNKFMRTALSAIRASIVTSHFPILLKQSLGGKNISGPDMQTLLDALVSGYLGVVGHLVQRSFESSSNNGGRNSGSDANNDGVTGNNYVTCTIEQGADDYFVCSTND